MTEFAQAVSKEMFKVAQVLIWASSTVLPATELL